MLTQKRRLSLFVKSLAVATAAIAGFVLGTLGRDVRSPEQPSSAPTLGAAEASTTSALPAHPGKVLIEAFYPHDERHKRVLELVRSFEQRYHRKVLVRTYEIKDPVNKPQDYQRWRQTGLPCAGIFVNGKNVWQVSLQRKTYPVVFQRRMGALWKKEELEWVVAQAVKKLAR